MANNIFTFQKNVTTHGTPVQLPAQTVDDDQSVLVKAKAGNTGSITVGNNSAAALNSGTGWFKLAAGQGVEIHSVHDTSYIWIDSTVDGEGVEVFVGGKVFATGGSGGGGGAVTNAGTFAVQADLVKVAGTNTVNGGLAGSQSVGGTVATNVAITDNPLNLGAQAVSSENTAVTATRKAQLVTDLVGKLIVLPYANPENFVSGITAAMTGTTTTSLLAAPASGLRNYITHIIVTNSHATVGTFVVIQDGSGGTTIYEGYAAPAGGGFSISFPTPLRQPTTATAIFCADVTTGANVIVSASGYKGA